MRIFWRHTGWLPFLAVLMFGKAIIPLVLIMTADSVVAVMLGRAIRQLRSRERQGRASARIAPRIAPRIVPRIAPRIARSA